MSDDNRQVEPDTFNLNTAPDLPFKEIVRFFHEHNVSGKCPVCGHDNWDLLGSVSGSDRHLLPNIPINTNLDGSTDLSGYNMSVVVATCTNCTFLRMHSRGRILEWVAANPAKDLE